MKKLVASLMAVVMMLSFVGAQAEIEYTQVASMKASEALGETLKANGDIRQLLMWAFFYSALNENTVKRYVYGYCSEEDQVSVDDETIYYTVSDGTLVFTDGTLTFGAEIKEATAYLMMLSVYSVFSEYGIFLSKIEE